MGRRPGGRATVAGVVAGVLAVGGSGAVAWVLVSQDHAPQPGPAAAGHLHSGGLPAPAAGRRASTSSTPSATSSAVPATGPVLARSLPVAIRIPAIGVSSGVQDLGLNPDGTIAVPQPGPLYNEAAWYEYSPTPGQLGPAVVEGHVDSAAEGPSVFFRLGALVPGEHVDVTRADHTVAVFTVTAVRRYPKDAFPTAAVYGNTHRAALRLVTCGGSFDRASGHYTSNIVVFADLTASRPAS